MGIGYAKGTVVAFVAKDRSKVRVSISDYRGVGYAGIQGYVTTASGGFRLGEPVGLDVDGYLISLSDHQPPERDYWLLSEATDRWYDFATRIGHYLFPDGRRHSVPEHTLIAGKGDLSDIHVRKMGVPVATEPTKKPERDHWLLDEASEVSDTPALDATTYTFPDGAVHHIDFASIRDMAQQGTLMATRVPKLKAGTTCVSWEFGDDSKWATGTLKNSWKPYNTATGTTGNVIFKAGSTYATASEMRSVDEMRVIAGTQTPRQWLDHRVSEIAEQGRL